MKRLILLCAGVIVAGCATDKQPEQTRLAVQRPPESWYFVPNETPPPASAPIADDYEARRQANALEDIRDQQFYDSLNR